MELVIFTKSFLSLLQFWFSHNKFTVVEVECLGACSNGPMIQINNDFFEDLDEDSTKKIIDNIKEGKPNIIGSQKGRRSSENA